MHNLAAVKERRPAVRDLTDPASGPHAIQLMLRRAIAAATEATAYHPAVDRSAAAMIPDTLLLRMLQATSTGALVVRPRAVQDDGGVGAATRHEVELWWIRRGGRLGLRELGRWLGYLAGATAPGLAVSAIPASAPHACDGRQLDVRVRGAWQTVATCGVVEPDLLRRSGLPDDASGLLVTLDLDRLVLLAKGIDDRGLLAARDPAIATQMLDLEPYVPPALTARRLAVVPAQARAEAAR